MSRTIKSINPLNVTAPNIVFNTSNLNLTSTPVVNNSNNNLLSRNNLTGNFEVVDTLTSTFKTDLQNVGGFNTLVQTPGSATTHNIKTIRSTTGSIAITSAATNLDLNANIMLSNLPSGGSAVLSNPGSGSSFNFKTLLANTGISISDNVDNVFVGLNPMTPSEIGGIYGSQRATEDNHIGFKNFVPDGSKSNVIGSELPSSLLGESSNIISSYINLSTANGTFSRSNVILSGDNSEINSTVNTHVMANDFAGSGLDMESSLYVGNMRNTKPTTVSACINQNLYGNTIEMGKNSWYIGSGRNNISLAPNEMHFDTGCDRLYYHDLATGSNSDVLFYDPVSGLITHENTSVLPPPPTVNIYNSNGTLTSNRTMTLGGFNLTISGVGAITIVSSAALTLDSSLGAVNLGTSTATSVSVGRSGINTTLGGNLFASHLALDNTKLNYLAYDSASKQIFYNSNINMNNIYTTSGSLTSSRLLSLNGFGLTILGTGAITITPSLTLNLDSTANGVSVGTSSATGVTIGRSGFNTTVNGSLTVNQAVGLVSIATDVTANSILALDGVGGVRVRNISTIPNIYNANGTLTSARNLTLGGFDLTTLGTGNYAVNNTGTVSIVPTSTTTVGTSGQIHNVNGALRFNNILSINQTGNSYLTIDQITKDVRYVQGGVVIGQIFSIGMNFRTTTSNGILTFPTSFLGATFGTGSPSNHHGYDETPNNGDTLNFATGVYTSNVARKVEVVMKLIIKNDTEIPDIELQFYNITLGFVASEATYTGVGAINTLGTYILVDRLSILTGNQFVFRINVRNTPGTTTTFQSTILSVNNL